MKNHKSQIWVHREFKKLLKKEAAMQEKEVVEFTRELARQPSLWEKLKEREKKNDRPFFKI